ncbi:unnamed protein product [Polarella glacialis]|uniref:Uncharacterized protein n=1 Tax=Polarella glacialis TaxID=89957 RepID=A0A813JGT9_POLGL|nr:unnamed protein product [Polarella glacialis]
MADPAEAVDPRAAAELMQRAEQRRKAEAELEEFHANRQRDIELRRQQHRVAEAARAAEAAGSVSSISPAAAAGMQAFAASGAGGGLNMEEMLKAAMGNPALVAVMQQALQGGSATPSTPLASVCPGLGGALSVRVREASQPSSAFRKVVLRKEGESGSDLASVAFKKVESSICSKFSSARGSDGIEVGLRRLVTLVRLSDNLQVGDDEDAAELVDGDELEATFAALSDGDL